MTITSADIINAAASVATDAAEGRLSPADMERQAVAELSTLMLVEPEPGTAMYELQAEVARRALARGALPADEVSEWAAVARRRECPGADTDSAAVVGMDASEPSAGPDVSPDRDSAVLAAPDAEDDPYADSDLTGIPDAVIEAAANADSDEAAATILENYRTLVGQ